MTFPNRHERRRVLLLAGTGAFLLLFAVWLLVRPGREQDRPSGRAPDPAQLAEAIERNDYVRLGFLLGNFAALPEYDDRGRPLLNLAAGGGHPECVEVLLFHGIPTETPDSLGVRPLAAAAAAGNLPALKRLLSGGAKLDGGRENGRTALILAAENGRSEAVDYLLNAGAAVWPGVAEGRGALSQAIRHGHETAALRLLDGGAPPDEVDAEGDSILMLAVRQRMKRLAARLLALKVDREHRNRAGETARGIAEAMNDSAMTALLRTEPSVE